MTDYERISSLMPQVKEHNDLSVTLGVIAATVFIAVFGGKLVLWMFA